MPRTSQSTTLYSLLHHSLHPSLPLLYQEGQDKNAHLSLPLIFSTVKFYSRTCKLMGSKLWLILLLSAVLMVVQSTAFDGAQCDGAECIYDENEMLMESETSRRHLEAQKYISYSALRSNAVPCSNRGQSYYNCETGARANPYNRGCSAISNCYRWTS